MTRPLRIERPDGRYHVRSAGGQGSHQLYAMALAGGLAIIPPRAEVKAGDELPMTAVRDLVLQALDLGD